MGGGAWGKARDTGDHDERMNGSSHDRKTWDQESPRAKAGSWEPARGIPKRTVRKGDARGFPITCSPCILLREFFPQGLLFHSH